MRRIAGNFKKQKFLFIASVLYVAGAVTLFPFLRFFVDNPDTISYISIARKYSLSDFSNAVNGYWSPLISWMLGLLLKFLHDEITAFKILQLLIGWFALFNFTKLGVNYETHSLLQDLRPEAMQEIERIHAAIDYSYDTSYSILHPIPDSSDSKGKWNVNKARKKALEERSASGDVKYMNAIILDPNLLSSLNQKYGADLFVFLTQVEIKTNAKDCIDFQSHIYQRDIKVHYSVYDKDGKQLFGDVASVKFPSNSNEIGDIMARNFPAIGEKITEAVGRQ